VIANLIATREDRGILHMSLEIMSCAATRSESRVCVLGIFKQTKKWGSNQGFEIAYSKIIKH